MSTFLICAGVFVIMTWVLGAVLFLKVKQTRLAAGCCLVFGAAVSAVFVGLLAKVLGA